jgi:predicted DNA binding CopG/RHH family protein
VVHFEFRSKSAQLDMRLPQSMLNAVKERAKRRRHIPCTPFLREAV